MDTALDSMSLFLKDLRTGLRQFVKRPASTLIAALAYAVGLGLVGLMLTIFFGVVRGHPEDVDFESVKTIEWDRSTRQLWKNEAQRVGIRYRDFYDIEQRQTKFDAIAASSNSNFSVVVDKYAERYLGSFVSADFFKALGVDPEIGRFYHTGDNTAQSPRMAVLSYSLWKNEFDGRESLIGESIMVDGFPTSVIGVAGEGFDFPSNSRLWINLRIDPLSIERTQGSTYLVHGTLKQGETTASALAEFNTIAKQLEQENPDTNTGYISFSIDPVGLLFIGDNLRQMMTLMLVCSVLVLCIACMNVANLTLARVSTRLKELAIRSSLGGSRRQLVRQMITEGLSIAVVGGIGGLGLRLYTSKAIWAWAAQADLNIPNWMNLDVDFEVIASLSVATLLASVIASSIPALKASRTDVSEILKDNSRGATGLRVGAFSKTLTFLQLCISCGILIATFSLVSTARNASVFEPYYNTAEMMVARFDLPNCLATPEHRNDALERLQEAMERNANLEGVGFTSAYDMISNWGTRWEAEGVQLEGDKDVISARQEIVSTNYFSLLGIPILYGRGFELFDGGPHAEQVCVMDELLARRIWPDRIQEAVGRRIRDTWRDDNPWLTVVGIVPDTKMAGPGLREETQFGGVYRPMNSAPQQSVTVFTKSNGSPLAMAGYLRTELRSIDPNIPLYRINSVQKAIENRNFFPLFYRNMFGMFGSAALALAAIGVYGVMSVSIRNRAQEFGIRCALGASNRSIVGLALKVGMVQVGGGVALGVALGWVLVSVLGGAVNGLTVDPMNYAIPVLTLVAISGLAIYSPVRQIVKSNLAKVLREE